MASYNFEGADLNVPDSNGEISTVNSAHLSVQGWGSSGLVNPKWVPPRSLIGTANTPFDVNQLNILLFVMTCLWLACGILIKRYLNKRSSVYVSRVISLIHAVLSTMYCAYVMLLRFLQFNSTPQYVHYMCCLPEPPLGDEQLAALFTASYFLADTIGILVGDYFDPLFIIHHVGALIILGTSVYGRIMGLEVAVGIVILECTNPQMHARWLLMENRYDEKNPNSPLWWFCDTGFLLTFFFARMIVGTTAATSFLFCPTAPIHISIVTFLFLVFSLKFLVDAFKKRAKGEKWTG
eukprot:GILI01015621.1.p1 GENE.GILI01015621.1~~GILI01015621.1.p1  ORF type:complete len:294 (-),score=51.46 GILI01015621.1:350-1231(-)